MKYIRIINLFVLTALTTAIMYMFIQNPAILETKYQRVLFLFVVIIFLDNISELIKKISEIIHNRTKGS